MVQGQKNFERMLVAKVNGQRFVCGSTCRGEGGTSSVVGRSRANQITAYSVWARAGVAVS